MNTFTYHLDDQSSFVLSHSSERRASGSTSISAGFREWSRGSMNGGPSHQRSLPVPGRERLRKKGSAGIFYNGVNSYYFKAVLKGIAYISVSVELSCPETF